MYASTAVLVLLESLPINCYYSNQVSHSTLPNLKVRIPKDREASQQ